MIEVEQLTKLYGTVPAIKDVSFQVKKGAVVGFLGPNGAGKSTTMRILCGCIGATSGRALVGGKDVTDDPEAVKRRIGYLPEIPPVYGNMSVVDYLRFAATIKGVDDVRTAVERTVGAVGLDTVRTRIIGHLSKGFRQRVGIAQALVHGPEVLVLDEPTSGLDPAQRKEIRDLLRELAEGEATVILSTHVLGEIEALCERVVIINNGQVVAEDSIDALAGSARRVRIRVARPTDGLMGQLGAVDGVDEVTPEGEGGFLIRASTDVREHVAHLAVPYGLIELGLAENLEEVYLRYTSGA